MVDGAGGFRLVRAAHVGELGVYQHIRVEGIRLVSEQWFQPTC
jgi:hypothetical protein